MDGKIELRAGDLIRSMMGALWFVTSNADTGEYRLPCVMLSTGFRSSVGHRYAEERILLRDLPDIDAARAAAALLGLTN